MPLYTYNLTIQKPAAVNVAITGSFSAPKVHEIVVARNKVLELLRVDANGKAQSVLATEVFGLIRSLAPFRLVGAQKDYIVAGSDSGRIVILDYDAQKNQFVKVHQETFGKSGCRRIVPGQYLAVDPRGRAVMIGAIEKQKLVYTLNRDAAARLTISSPLEAHKSHTVCYSMCGVDVGFENPIFAALELDHGETDEDSTGASLEKVEKMVTFYELDLGVNHVVRKWSEAADRLANLLITVPGGGDGPGGVLVCSENMISWKNQGHEERSVLIPRRPDTLRDRGVLIVSYAVHKQKDMFFFLLQSEVGDLYKVTLEYKNNIVSGIVVKYFDTIPTCTSLVVLRSGFLFAAAEFGNHALYQFQSLGEDDPTSMFQTDDPEDPFTYVRPRELKNLMLVDDIPSLGPITDMKVVDLANEGAPQIYTLNGRGPRSTLRVLRHGLEVTEMAVSEMPGNPTSVWTVKKRASDAVDSYIVVSFTNATMVLSIGDTVEESNDSGFNTDSPTLAVGTLGEDALVQVHPMGIRFIRADRRINEWKTPGKRPIVKATLNNRQVILALAGGELLLFDLDVTGQLNEVAKKQLKAEVAALDVEALPEGRMRARYVAVGSVDNTVRIFSLDPDSPFTQKSILSLSATPESLAIVEMGETKSADASASSLFLNIGLKNGVLLRISLDNTTGQLTDQRTRFLGARPVKLFKVRVQNNNAIIALSSRSWLSYNFQARFHLTPLSYEMLEHASSFVSDQCPEGVVSIAANTLRIITLEKLGQVFNEVVVPLRYTPRKAVIHPTTQTIITMETDHNAFSAEARARMAVEQKRSEEMETDGSAPFDSAAALAAQLEEQAVQDRLLGAPMAGHGRWASCIRVYDPIEDKSSCVLELEENECATSICTCVFQDRGGEVNIVVGSAKNMTINPRGCTQGFISIYRLVQGNQLQLLSKTAVEGIPGALCPFQGRLLAGVGRLVRVYELGKRRLLRKCETKLIPNTVVGLWTQGDRVIIADVTESFHYANYRRDQNVLNVFADDSSPRWITAGCQVDYDTMAGGDKWGNLFLLRLPEEITDEVANRFEYEIGFLNAAAHKLDNISNYHVGEAISSLAKTPLVAGGMDVVVYSTLTGSIGAMIPFSSREDVDFFLHLEMHMRQEHQPLMGRDHMAFRSYYFPVKDAIDGDLCEQFNDLDPVKQRRIAEELDRTPSEVAKKLEDMRNRNCM